MVTRTPPHAPSRPAATARRAPSRQALTRPASACPEVVVASRAATRSAAAEPPATPRALLSSRAPSRLENQRRPSSRGTTFVELLVTTVILAILATAVLPIAEAARRREQELQLRRALREIRLALDTYHRTCLVSGAQQSSGNPGGQGGNARPGQQLVTFTPEDDPDRTCYPKDLDVLVEGVETNIPDYELRFLRRIPKDPFNYDEEEHDGHGWEYRSATDDPERNLSWDRRNVFDVRSGSEWQSLDGSYYKDW